MARSQRDGLRVDSVAIHSRQKHALLEAYLKVWTKNVAANWGADAPSLDIYDLFAGTGWCVEKLYQRDEWPGTALVEAAELRDYPSKRRCRLFLNSWTEGRTESAATLDALRHRVNALGFERPNREVHFWSGQLTEVLGVALERHSERAQYPSLWVLDPYAASALPWDSVRQIASQVGTYRDRKGQIRTRRPELFINFMTSGLQENIHHPTVITTALGCSEADWSEHRAEVERTGGNVLDALTSFYFDRLIGVYGRPPFVLGIPGKDGNPVSMIFMAVEHEAAWHSIRRESLPHFATWLSQKYEPRKEWVRAKHRIDRHVPKGQRQAELDYFSSG
jgi:three-Cys-motif partner protein